MAVEILILSGARQGERVVLEATNFRVGPNSDCAVCFDPLLDTGSANRSASFCLMEDGWYIVHAYGAILINQRAVAGPTRIRSGDVVRMSERGPDFSFNIVSMAKSERTNALGKATYPPPILDRQEVSTPPTAAMYDAGSPPQTTTQAISSMVPPSVASPSLEQNVNKAGTKDLPTPVNITINTSNRENWILLAVCVAVACIGFVILYGKLGQSGQGDGSTSSKNQKPPIPDSSSPIFKLTGPTSGTYAPGQPITITWTAANMPAKNIISLCLNPDESLDNGKERWIVEDKVSDANGDGSYTFDCSGFPPGNYYIGGSIKDKATGRKWNSQLTSYITITSLQPPKPEKTTTEERIAAQIKDAVFLIKVEKAGRFWPLGTCCAIGKKTLLTSAWVACRISELRKDPQKGFHIWVTNPASDVQMAVQDIYINALIATLEDKPDDFKYYDVALLTVAEELPKIIPLATNEEIDKLNEGLTIYCAGFTHEFEKITEHDSFQPQVMPGKIYLINAPKDLPSHPILLQIKGKNLNNTFGSPIVNDQGKIVAIYGDAMQPKSNAGKYLPEIHYAAVLNLEFINLGLNRKFEKIWTSPDLFKIVSKAKDER
jgi:hypothetical protein